MVQKIINFSAFLYIFLLSCQSNRNLPSPNLNESCFDTLKAINRIQQYAIRKMKPSKNENLLFEVCNCDSDKVINKRISFEDYTKPNVWYCDTAFYVNVKNTENNKTLNLVLDCKTCKITNFPKVHKIK